MIEIQLGGGGGTTTSIPLIGVAAAVLYVIQKQITRRRGLKVNCETTPERIVSSFTHIHSIHYSQFTFVYG